MALEAINLLVLCSSIEVGGTRHGKSDLLEASQDLLNDIVINASLFIVMYGVFCEAVGAKPLSAPDWLE